MKIVYKNNKDLPNDQLHKLFVAVGWSKNDEDQFKLNNFNAPFKNSTLVFSAWDNDTLVGCVRVISDKVIRSVVEDLAVLPEYQNKGIGSYLLKMCIDTYPKSEWLIPTTKEMQFFYEKNGFKKFNCVFLNIPCKWF